ncbi:hypothetical protein Syun_014132 [Stephania yunnanensis]|uniref:Uncharacterized protein n=1 Tax=Stephania yunnanensis TaxID=152371 RepID=A0AAP0JIX7_9MAGN
MRKGIFLNLDEERSHDDLMKFKCWFSSKDDAIVDLNYCIEDRPWFRILWTKDKWLDNKHSHRPVSNSLTGQAVTASLRPLQHSHRPVSNSLPRLQLPHQSGSHRLAPASPARPPPHLQLLTRRRAITASLGLSKTLTAPSPTPCPVSNSLTRGRSPPHSGLSSTLTAPSQTPSPVRESSPQSPLLLPRPRPPPLPPPHWTLRPLRH